MRKHEVKKALVCLEVERHRRVLTHLERVLAEPMLPEVLKAVHLEMQWRKTQLGLLAYKRKSVAALKGRALRA